MGGNDRNPGRPGAASLVDPACENVSVFFLGFARHVSDFRRIQLDDFII